MTEIRVRHAQGDDYTVEVREGEGATRHLVTVNQAHMSRFGGESPEALLKESFRFLLEREPKEAILSRFEISVIARYFPEYEQEIRRRQG